MRAVAAAAVLLPLTTVLAAAVVGATASLRYRRRRRIRRACDEGRTLEAALDVLVGELRVGSHPVRAFGVAAGETVGAVAVSLRAVAARARLGADVAAGLRAAATIVGPAHALGSTRGVLAAGQRPRPGDSHADACRATRYR